VCNRVDVELAVASLVLALAFLIFGTAGYSTYGIIRVTEWFVSRKVQN
jgi:hypothetical protein